MRRIDLEALETRRLFAQVVYPPSGVDLSGDNIIDVSSNSSGGFTIKAYTSGGTLINTTIFGFSDSLKVDAGLGNDIVQPASGTSIVKPVYFIGGGGNDSLLGGDANDTLEGSGGNDRLYVGNGNDTMIGGSGGDTVTGELLASGAAMYYKIDGVANDYVVVGGSTVKTDSVNLDVENLVGGPSNDELSGSSSDNYMDGAGGDDSLYGGSGDDSMYGMGGSDYMNGGPGTDTMLGGISNDTLEGGSGAFDYLQGEDGNDRFNLADAVGNQDTGIGGAGNDVLNAKDPDDLFVS